MLAGKERLHNLTVVIDRNNIQIDGFTEDIMPLNPLADKWKSFNFHVQEIDGHNIAAVIGAFEQARSIFDRPSVIIAYTVASKGIPEFERMFEWHGKPPQTKEEIEIARRAFSHSRTWGGAVKNEHHDN